MKSNITLPVAKMRHGMVAAMVLGTALSGLGHSTALAGSEPNLRAVSDISRYCVACWRNARINPDCWNDCTQDVLVRLLERLQPADWDRVLQADGDERREFLRAVDAVKKRSQRQHRYAALPSCDVAGKDEANGDDRALVDEAATEALTARQRQVLRLSFEGASVHEIADELRLPPERVSDEKYKAIRKLRQHLGVNG